MGSPGVPQGTPGAVGEDTVAGIAEVQGNRGGMTVDGGDRSLAFHPSSAMDHDEETYKGEPSLPL